MSYLKFAATVGRLGTESAFVVLSRAQALAAQGHDIINLGIGQQGDGISGLYQNNPGVNLSNMLNQPSNFSLNYNGQTPDVSNIGGTFSQADSDYFMNNMQYMNKGSFNMDSQGLQTLPTLNSSGVQSNYNSPQNMLPTNNYTGCFQNLYYVNGNYTQPC